MPTIDADAHVIETEETWSYVLPEDSRYTPIAVDQRNGPFSFWRIEDRTYQLQNIGPNTTKEAREMTDIEGRLAHMDELDVNVQILYPTLLLRALTDRAAVELAITRGYNRWLANIYERGKGRLRWAAVLPYMTLDAAIEELKFAKDHGACAFMMHGTENFRLPTDSYFFPLYEEAEKMDMPVCIHAGTGSLQVYDYFATDVFTRFRLSAIGVCGNLIYSGIPKNFPNLRWGFIEFTSAWLPFILGDLIIRAEAEVALQKQVPDHPIFSQVGIAPKGMGSTQTMLGDNNIYVACQTSDDFPYVLACTGDDNLVIGTDYGHADYSNDIEAMHKMASGGLISEETARKITSDNPARLYGL